MSSFLTINDNTNESKPNYLIVLITVVICIYLIYRLYHVTTYSDEDYNQTQLHNAFNLIHGEVFDDEAKNAITYGNTIENPRAIDHFRLGVVYLLNADNQLEARNHFEHALNQIINGEVATRDAPFILNRIEDFNGYFIDYPDLDDLPLQQALNANYTFQRTQIEALKDRMRVEKPAISAEDPAFVQKSILSRQEWQSDSQNVHDSAVYTELADQFKSIAAANAKNNLQSHTYEECIDYLYDKYKKDPVKTGKLNDALNFIGRNEVVNSIGKNTREKDIITTVWQRTFDKRNRDNADVMREALADSILDCNEGGYTVCMAGRTSKVWQALAKLDHDDSAGILKTKQTIRNEIYELAAKTVDSFVGENGSASQALKDAYTADEDTEQVKELKTCMKDKIDEIANDYKDLLDAQQINAIIEECKAVV